MNTITRKQARKLGIPIPPITLDGHPSGHYQVVIATLKVVGLTAKDHHKALEHVERHMLKKNELVLMVTSKEIPTQRD